MTSTSVPSVRRPIAEHAVRSLTFRRGTGGCVGVNDASPTRDGSCSSRHRNRRSGARRFNGCGVPGERWAPTASTTPASASTVRNVAVDDREGLTIVGADSDFQPHGTRLRIVDHPTHLEAAHLS